MSAPDPVLAEACVVEQDAGDDERPGERAASRLVRTGDEPRAEPAVELEELLAGPAHEVEDTPALSRHLCRKVCLGLDVE